MNINNKHHEYLRLALCILYLTVALEAKNAKLNTVKTIQELDNITLSYYNKQYHVVLGIAHHQYQMKAFLKGKRSWVKEFTCTSCLDNLEICDTSCYSDKQAFKISCDASFCDKMLPFKDEQLGLQGFDGQIFAKLNSKQQVVIPLIFATKLQHNVQQAGQYNIFDPDSSFDNGIIIKLPSNQVMVVNSLRLKRQQIDRYCPELNRSLVIKSDSYDLEVDNIKMSSMIIRNVQNDSYAQFNYDQQLSLELSLGQLGISLPRKLFKDVEKYILSSYFANNSCKMASKRLKCNHEISMKDLFDAIMIFNLDDHQKISIPLHSLFTSCGANQCTSSLIMDETQNSRIVVGHLFLQLYHLQFSINNKEIKLYHKQNPWTTLLQHTKINTQKIGFLQSIFILVFHIMKRIIIIILWLSLFSLCLSFLINWRKVLLWLKRLLFRTQKSQPKEVPQEQQTYQTRSFRRRDKVVNPFEDMQTL